MRFAAPKVATATAVSAAAIAAVLVLWHRSRSPAPVRFVDQSAATELLLLARQLEPRGLAPIDLSGAADEPVQREPLDEATVRQIFPIQDFLVFDPVTCFRYRGGLDMKVDLASYPGGSFRRRTNSAGEREDHETFAPPPDLFVLVAGDSHTDGLCVNAESYPNRLEERLARPRPGLRVEVLNAGVQGASFVNYLGVLEKYAPRGPDAFVAGVYGGNDFLETLRIHHFYRKTVPPPRTQNYWFELSKLDRVGPAAAAQGVDALLYFKHYPDQVEVALEAAVGFAAEADRACKKLGIPWIALYIPSPFDADFPEHRDLAAKVREAMGFSEFDLRVLGRIADRAIERWRERGVEVLDLRPVFLSEPGPWYGSDLHIVPRAHERIAELLEPRMERALAALR